MKALESKFSFRPIEKPVSEQIEELQEKQKDNDDLTGVRPIVNDSDEESGEDEDELAKYPKNKAPDTKKDIDMKEPRRRDNDRKRDSRGSYNGRQGYKQDRSRHEGKYKKENEGKKDDKGIMYPYPYSNPQMCYYYPPGYPQPCKFIIKFSSI